MGPSKELTLTSTPPYDEASPWRRGRIRQITPNARRLGRAITAPSPRSLLGGALVATSVVVLFGISNETDDPAPMYLVAAQSIPAGRVLTESDLATAPMELHAETAELALRDPEDAVGSMTIGPMSRGDLLATSRLTEPTKALHGAARIVSIELPLADALGGSLAPTQLVDVVAVTPDASTVLAREVPIVDADSSDADGIGISAGIRISLALSSETEALAVIDARREGSLVLVQSTDALGTDRETTDQ